MGRSAEGSRKDIFEVLTREHRLVSGILDRIESLCEEEEGEQALAAFEILKQKLLPHARAEEAAVYPRFAEASDELRELMGEAKEEHALVEQMIEEISSLDVEDDAWKAKFTVLKELVEHHVEDEEGDVFAAAGKALDEETAIELAEQFLAAKAKTSSDEKVTPLDVELMTKEEMLQKAREMGLEGVSKMTKAQLAQVLNGSGR